MTATISNLQSKLNLQSALWYASRGFYVFPVYEITNGQCSCYAGLQCYAPGKHPRTGQGLNNATNDVEKIKEWWQKWPNAGVAIAAGMSGLIVLDVDPRNRGDQTLATLPLLPTTPRVLTGGGGWHYFFRKPNAEPFASGVLAPGIDLKSDGGYVIAPPSNHLLGQYRVDPHANFDLPIADLPDWILEKRKEAKPRRRSYARVSDGFLGAAFEAAGWLGKSLGSDKQCVTCPWEKEHTSGKRHDGSTVVFAPVEGSHIGWAHCSHSHCNGRTLNDWLAALPETAKQAAKERLGVDEYYTPKDDQSAPLPADNWVHRLIYDTKRLVKDSGNVALLLANDSAWKGCIAYNEFKDMIVWLKQPAPIDGMTLPALGQWSDNDVTFIQHQLRETHHVTFPVDAIRMGVSNAAASNPYHPVRNYLRDLQWDHIPRAERWLNTYLGVPDTPYSRLISRWWVIATVARIFRPGSKVDSILILEGPQGVGKSTALRILGHPWFTDTPIDIGSKDAYLAMRGYWIIELAELESLGRAEASRAKAFFTSPVDVYRKPYEREVVEINRQCNFAGTVNHNQYLHDETGGRRFHPVECGKINLDALQRDRDQLWAEAVYLYDSGITWWPVTLEEQRLCSSEQSERYVSDEWEQVIYSKISPEQCYTTADILQQYLGFLPKEWNRGHEMRVNKCMKRLGFKTRKNNSRREWVK